MCTANVPTTACSSHGCVHRVSETGGFCTANVPTATCSSHGSEHRVSETGGFTLMRGGYYLRRGGLASPTLMY